MTELRLTWTKREFYRQAWDLSNPEHVAHLAFLLEVDDEPEESLPARVREAALQVDEDPDYEIQDRFLQDSGRSNWFDVDLGDCVRITNVEVIE